MPRFGFRRGLVPALAPTLTAGTTPGPIMGRGGQGTVREDELRKGPP